MSGPPQPQGPRSAADYLTEAAKILAAMADGNSPIDTEDLLVAGIHAIGYGLVAVAIELGAPTPALPEGSWSHDGTV